MIRLGVFLFALMLAWPAFGQTTVRPCITTGTNTCPPVSAAQPMPVTSTPSSVGGLTPATSAALVANQVIKNSAGNLYSLEVSADSTLSSAAWWLMLYDAASAPGDGAVTPQKCFAFPSGTTLVGLAFPTPVAFTTGIVAGVSTTGCFTKTASTHAFISGDAQ